MESNREYGLWLRASPHIGIHKLVVSVPGFYTKKGREMPRQRGSGNIGKLKVSKAAPVKSRTNMERVEHGNSPISIFEDTFLTDNHKIDSYQSNPDLVHTINSGNLFE